MNPDWQVNYPFYRAREKSQLVVQHEQIFLLGKQLLKLSCVVGKGASDSSSK